MIGVDNLLFSSIGLYIKTHPIFEVAMNNPRIQKVYLFYSDEPHPKGIEREPTTKNIEEIAKYFEKSTIPVTSEGFDQYKFTENTYKMAAYMINELLDYPGHYLVLDLSAGRVPIKQALARAGEIVYNFFKTRDRDIRIVCSMRPEEGDLVEYIIGDYDIPDEKDAQLLRYLAVEGYKAQRIMVEDLDWTNQSEVSKALKRLNQMGLYEKLDRKLTPKGKHVSMMFSYLES